MSKRLSVILPCYNEEKSVLPAFSTIRDILEQESIDFEILFVDDGSKDGTWNEIQGLSRSDNRVKGVRFTRNFGKESAIFAGLEYAEGDCCVILDCDLQHPPAKIVEMFRLWEQGYEVVEGVKSSRGKESASHRLAAKLFYSLISKAVGMDMENASDFKLLDRRVVDSLNQMPERHVFFRALSYWVGFKTASVSYDVQERKQGTSKWSTRSLVKYALNNVASFSSAPLHIVTVLGFITLLFSLVLGVIALVQKILGQALGGFTTVILIELFIGSVLMISIGIIGYYIGRIYEEIKARPRYIVAKFIRQNENKD